MGVRRGSDDDGLGLGHDVIHGGRPCADPFRQRGCGGFIRIADDDLVDAVERGQHLGVHLPDAAGTQQPDPHEQSSSVHPAPARPAAGSCRSAC